MVLSLHVALLPPTLTSRDGTGSASPTTNRSLTSLLPQGREPVEEFMEPEVPLSAPQPTDGRYSYTGIFPLEPCVHEPGVALKLGCFCIHFQEKKAPVCHEGRMVN